MKIFNLLNRTKIKLAKLRAVVSDASQTEASYSSNSDIVALEERIMLSATPMAVVVATQPADPVDCPDNIDAQIDESKNSVVNHVASVVFVDSSVEDYQQLVDDIDQTGQSTEVVLLNNQTDGIDQISGYLSRHTDIESIHIVSHGSDGEVRLGNTRLNADTLNSYAGQMAAWSSSITASADILFYGCDLAATEDGRFVIEALSELTGADIVASDDVTGNANLGGDWDLEFVVGLIETDVVFSADLQQHWFGTLETVTVTTLDDVVDGDTSSIDSLIANSGADNSISLREAIIAANGDLNPDTIVLSSGVHALTLDGNGNNLGDLNIRSEITIEGIGAGESFISSGISDRIFNISDGAQLTLQGITLQNGRSVTGGAVLVGVDGSLHATDIVFRDNSATTSGGAIYSSGAVSLIRASLVNNSSDVRGGAITVFAGTTDLTNVTVSGNTANTSGGGIIVVGGSLTVNHSTIANNTAVSTSGGGLRVSGGESTTISNSIFADNVDGSVGSNADVSGLVTSGGYNIIEGTEGVNNLVETDAHGVESGLSQTLTSDPASGQFFYSLKSSSIAFDGAVTSTTIVDQRGFIRNSIPDIGAFEAERIEGTPALPADAEVSIIENTGSVGTFEATDPDGDEITYSLSGADAGRFRIDSKTGTVSFVLPPNFETPTDSDGDNVYEFTVVATDDGIGMLSDSQNVSVAVTNANEAPILPTSPSKFIDENDTFVETLTAVDPDGDTVFFSLEGVDADFFNLNSSTGELNFISAPDFETPLSATGDNAYSITIVATDDGAGALTDRQNVRVFVLDLDETNRAPFFSDDLGLVVDENITSVGTFATIDPNGDTLTYSLNGSDATLFSIDSSTGEVSFVAAPDFETPLDSGANNTYDFEVVATDDGGLMGSQRITVVVTNVNEAPQIQNLDGDVINFTGGDAQTLLDAGADALVSDVDSVDFDSGSLTVTINSAADGIDKLVFGSTQITTSGTLVFHDGTQIGSFSSNSSLPAQTETLKIDFNANADASAITALIRAIAYENSNPSLPSGVRTVDFVLEDGDNSTSTVSTVTVNIAAKNAAPESVSSVDTFIEDTTKEFTIKGTDTDGNVAEIRILSLPINGTLYTDAALTNEALVNSAYETADDSLTLFFVPNENFNGDTSFEFTTIDDQGFEAVASGRKGLAGTAVNDAPVLNNVGVNTLTAITEDDVTSMGDLVRDIIGDPDDITDVDANSREGIAIFDADSTNGTWEYSTNGGITWTGFGSPTTSAALLLTDAALVRFVPEAEFSGDAEFLYRAWDQTIGEQGDSISLVDNVGGTGPLSVEIDTISITVNSENDAPVVDTEATLQLADISEDDVNPLGQTVESILASDGVDRVSDVDGDTVGLAIYDVDDSNGQWQYSLDEGGNWIAFGEVSSGTAVLLDPTSMIRFIPNADSNGTSQIFFQAWDQSVGANGQTDVDLRSFGGSTPFSGLSDNITVTVIPVNDAPTVDLDANDSTGISGADFRTTFMTGGGAVALTDGAKLDDVDGPIQSLTISISNIQNSANELLSFDSGILGFDYSQNLGILRLTATPLSTNADFEQALNSLTYENTSTSPNTTQRVVTFVANDGELDSDIATAFVSLEKDAEAPVLVNNSGGIVDEGATLTISSTELQFSDFQGPTSIKYSVTSAPSNGFLALSFAPITPINSFTQENINLDDLIYVHDGSETTSDQFLFIVDDGLGNSNFDQFDIVVNPINDSPVAVNDIGFTTPEDTPIIIALSDLLANDSDVDGDTLQLTIPLESDPSNGTVFFNSDGSLTYTPNANFFGADSFVYSLSDGNGGVAQATVGIDVSPVNDDPVAVDDRLNTLEDSELLIDSGDLLANDSDIDGDPLQINSITTDPINGTVVINGDGTLTYKPDLNFFGDDSFTYEVTDGRGGRAEATVDLTIVPQNDSPRIRLTNLVNAIEENTDTESSIRIANIVVVDDNIGVNDISLSGDDAFMFEIVGNELRIAAGAALDFESNSAFEVTVEVDDSTIGFEVDDSIAHTLNLIDVNESPTISLENVVHTFPVGTDFQTRIKIADIQIADDALGTEALLLSGTDADLFEIVDNELWLNPSDSIASERLTLSVAVQVDDLTIGQSFDDSVSLEIQTNQLSIAVPIVEEPELDPEPKTERETDFEENVMETIEQNSEPTQLQEIVSIVSQSTPRDAESRASTVVTQEIKQQAIFTELDQTKVTDLVVREASEQTSTFAFVEYGELVQRVIVKSNLVIPSLNQFTVSPVQLTVNQFGDWIQTDANHSLALDQVVVGSSAIATTSLSVGYVVWMLRGGSLFASFVTSLPAWTSFDLLPVLKKFDEESLADIANQ